MPAPTFPWVDPSPALVDQDSGVTVTDWEARRQRQIFLKEVLYGTGSFVGNVPHSHVGTEDAEVITAATGNLINDGCPDNDATTAWTMSGYGVENDYGFRTTTASGDYAWQTVCRQAYMSKPIFGTGAELVTSIFIRAKDVVPTAGEIHFGLSDGSTTFKASCKAVITAAMITSSWQRFYLSLSAATTGTWTNECRFLLKNHTTAPNQKCLVTAIAVNIGRQLPYWSPGIIENENSHDGNHAHWGKYGLSDCPIFDESVAITGAIAINGT